MILNNYQLCYCCAILCFRATVSAFLKPSPTLFSWSVSHVLCLSWWANKWWWLLGYLDNVRTVFFRHFVQSDRIVGEFWCCSDEMVAQRFTATNITPKFTAAYNTGQGLSKFWNKNSAKLYRNYNATWEGIDGRPMQSAYDYRYRNLACSANLPTVYFTFRNFFFF